MTNTKLGRWTTETLYFLGGYAYLCRQIVSELFRTRFEWRLLTEQIFQIGSRSMPLVLITALSTGMVMTLQFGIGLMKFGGAPYVPKIVSLSILREMGPVFTSLMVAARVGAGMASEIGSMVVTGHITDSKDCYSPSDRLLYLPPSSGRPSQCFGCPWRSDGGCF